MEVTKSKFISMALGLTVLVLLQVTVSCSHDLSENQKRTTLKPVYLQGQPEETRTDNSGNEEKTTIAFDPAYKLNLPLQFPVENFKAEMILSLPDSRIPGAQRNYRGSKARHKGIDLYTNECGLKVYAPADGWIIYLMDAEQFPDGETRDAILKITDKTGFTPDPVLEILNGCSLVIYHGMDDKGNYCYSRLSHLDLLDKEYRIGDFLKKGDTVGFVGASGTSSNFKSKSEKKLGCHLHFEWHQMKNDEDKVLGLDERDADLKRKMYHELFKSGK
jgi:murein DD-endopeptidase MepM/ murein hydrolase activator NlpD